VDAEITKRFHQASAGFEADSVHAGFAGTGDEAFHVINKNGFFRPETDLLQNTPVDLEIGLTSAYFMRRESSLKVAENPELLLDMREMERVGI